MIEKTSQCLELLDGCKISRRHKNLVRGNIIEIKKLLNGNPSATVKVLFFAGERLETLLADMRRLSGTELKAPEVYALVGGSNSILKIARFLVQEEQDAPR